MMRDGGDDEDEEWGGAAMDVEDADMMADDDDDGDDGDASVIKQEQDGVIRRRRGDTPEAVARRMQRGAGNDDDDGLGADDDMLDDLAATADSDAEDGEDENHSAEMAANGDSSVLLAASLPLQLLALSRPATRLSFLPLTAFDEASTAASSSKGSSNGLIGTAAVEGSAAATLYPAALSTLSEAVTTIHVRAIEALNNLYVTLSRGKKTRRDPKELQEVFETALGLVQGALEAAGKASPQASASSNDGAAAAAASSSSSGKKGKSGGGSGTKKQQEEEVDEVQERRREVVMAGMGVVWGCTILGLDPERNGKLVRCTSDPDFRAHHDVSER